MRTDLVKFLILLLEILYVTGTVILFAYAMNMLAMAVIYLVNRRRIWNQPSPPQPKIWPKVTFQLPIFNERYTVKRLIDAAARLDYPADRLEIQVLDDSTDDTAALAENLVESYRDKGVNIHYIHRADRSGYKAGALENGLKTATGEYVAVVDADFVPPVDWLRRTMPYFDNDRLAFVQTRWHHQNYRYNLLTRLQALMLDGHFVVEQSARYGGGLMMGFNGSGGIWRCAAIADAGGWSAETLTEDLDLSFRAQLRGWKVRYLPAITVPGELPPTMDAFKVQQHRWAKGQVQTARKMLAKVWAAKLPLHVKIAATFHTLGYSVFLVMALVMLLTLPVGLFAPAAFRMFPLGALAVFGPPLFYMSAASEHFPRWYKRLAAFAGVTVAGPGLMVGNAIAVLNGMFHTGGEFVRTPKYNLKKGEKWTGRKYTTSWNLATTLELIFGVYLVATVYILWPTVGRLIAPALLVNAAGLFFSAGASLIQNWTRESQSMRRSGFGASSAD